MRGEVAAANEAKMRSDFISETDRTVHGSSISFSLDADVAFGCLLELPGLLEVSESGIAVVGAVLSAARVALSRFLRYMTSDKSLFFGPAS